MSYPIPEITEVHPGDCSWAQNPYICVVVAGQHNKRYEVVDKHYLDIERVKLSEDDNFAVADKSHTKALDVLTDMFW